MPSKVTMIQMTYFNDLSNYAYLPEFARPRSLNVGWLGLGHDFDKMTPSDADLNLLWEFCKVSIAQTRGIHNCDFCKGNQPVVGERNGLSLLLGTSEIRVFSPDGTIYAAPTLIYHYVLQHNYRPPDEFMNALRVGDSPPMEDYFNRLRNLGLEWTDTSGTDAEKPTFRFGQLRQ